MIPTNDPPNPPIQSKFLGSLGLRHVEKPPHLDAPLLSNGVRARFTDWAAADAVSSFRALPQAISLPPTLAWHHKQGPRMTSVLLTGGHMRFRASLLEGDLLGLKRLIPLPLERPCLGKPYVMRLCNCRDELRSSCDCVEDGALLFELPQVVHMHAGAKAYAAYP